MTMAVGVNGGAGEDCRSHSGSWAEASSQRIAASPPEWLNRTIADTGRPSTTREPYRVRSSGWVGIESPFSARQPMTEGAGTRRGSLT